MHTPSPPPSEDVATRLRERGGRLTPQRLMILDIVREGLGHLTAEQVLERAIARYPYINQATVYRTLIWLREQDLVSEADLGGGHTEYEYRRAGHPHHHLVCAQCHRRIELADEIVAPLADAIHTRYGFVARLDHLAVFGVCQVCQGHEEAQQVTEVTAPR